MSETPPFGRYAEIPYDKMTPEQQAGYKAMMAARGSLPGPNKIWVHNPKLAKVIAAQTNEQKLEAMRLTLEAQLKSLVEDNGRRLEQIRQDATATARLNRDEGAIAMKSFNDSVVKIMGEMAARQLAQLDAFSTQLAKLTESNAKKFEELRAIVETRLAQIQADNTNKLEEMRRTVDEKLQGTLERRLVLQFFLDLPG